MSPVAVHHSKKTAESPTACAMAVTTADLCPAGKGRTRSHPHAPRLCSPEHACGAEHAWRIAAESMATRSQLQCCALQCHGLLTYPRLPRAGMRISRRVSRTARASYLHTRKAAGPAPSPLQMGEGMWSSHGCCAAAAHLWSAAEVLGRERGTRPLPLGDELDCRPAHPQFAKSLRVSALPQRHKARPLVALLRMVHAALP